MATTLDYMTTTPWLTRLHIQASHPQTVFDAVTNADQGRQVEKYVMVRLGDLREALNALQRAEAETGTR